MTCTIGPFIAILEPEESNALHTLVKNHSNSKHFDTLCRLILHPMCCICMLVQFALHTCTFHSNIQVHTALLKIMCTFRHSSRNHLIATGMMEVMLCNKNLFQFNFCFHCFVFYAATCTFLCHRWERCLVVFWRHSTSSSNTDVHTTDGTKDSLLWLSYLVSFKIWTNFPSICR